MNLDLELPSFSCLVSSCYLLFVFTIINIKYVLQMFAAILKKHVANLSELLLYTWTVCHLSIFTAIRQLSSIFTAIRQLSSIFTAIRQLSSIFTAIRQLSSIFTAIRQLSSGMHKYYDYCCNNGKEISATRSNGTHPFCGE